MTGQELGSADVAIIGGGLIGCATAYYLAAGGIDVALFERSDVNREASGTNAGSLHFQIYIHSTFPSDYIDRIRPTIALMRESATLWAEVEKLLDADCGVRLGGGLWVAETDSEMDLIRAKVQAENEMGVPSEVRSRREMLDVAPYIGPEVIGGAFHRGEGFANPLLVAPAYVRAAKRLGARLLTNTPVQAIERVAGGEFRLQTPRGVFRAGRVVAAAGVWTAEIARMIGLTLPVWGSVAQVSVTEPRPPVMLDQLLQHVGKGLTLKQSPKGAFIIGGGWHGHYDRATNRKGPRLDSLIGNTWVAARTVPDVAQAQLIRSWAGIGPDVRDGLPMIGGSERVRGFHVVVAPLGFTMGPLCARLFSEQYLTKGASLELDPYSPNRF